MDREKRISIPIWIASVSVPVLLTLGGWIWMASQFALKVEAQESTNAVLFNKVNEARDLATKHEAVIPRIETRMDRMDDKLDKILAAVK